MRVIVSETEIKREGLVNNVSFECECGGQVAASFEGNRATAVPCSCCDRTYTVEVR